MAAFLEIHRPEGVALVVLDSESVAIGRDASNQVPLEHDLQVSRLHAVLESYPAGWCVRDLGSRNGTYVNGDRINGNHRLSGGEEIRVGTTRLVYRAEVGGGRIAETVGALPPPQLTARERDVLIALLGPLGSGKLFTEPASTRDIAEALFVSEAAVKQHLANLYDKFGIYGDNRRLQLANEALQRGAVSLNDLRPDSPTSG